MAPARPRAFTDDSRNGVTKEHETANGFYRFNFARGATYFKTLAANTYFSFDTGFDTASRFSVLNGIKWQHGGRVVK